MMATRMGSYNGFSGDKRAEVSRWMYAEFEAGRMVRPTICALCERENVVIQTHLEDYDKPTEFVGMCRRCHMALHGRFNRPEGWTKLLGELDRALGAQLGTRRGEAILAGKIPTQARWTGITELLNTLRPE